MVKLVTKDTYFKYKLTEHELLSIIKVLQHINDEHGDTLRTDTTANLEQQLREDTGFGRHR